MRHRWLGEVEQRDQLADADFAGVLSKHVHQLHPHSKRGLLIEWGGWGDAPTGEAIHSAMAQGRIDYYVLRPAGRPDEVFHQAVSSFLLEWSHSQKTAPHTIYVVGRSWSGRLSSNSMQPRVRSTWRTA